MNTSPLSATEVAGFQAHVYRYFSLHGRSLPWRFSSNPWHIFVSEIMLQQTQVSRVAEKYPPFIEAFPTPQALAQSPFPQVLALWNGLGYNRRARFLHSAAQQIHTLHHDSVPSATSDLMALSGIGAATAAAIRAYAFNLPEIFIETNIRAVYIYHFFPQNDAVDDCQLLPYLSQTLDKTAPARWYNALMDYGVLLKRTLKNPAKRSKHHSIQSTFAGSDRELRGKVIRILLQKDKQPEDELIKAITDDPARGERIIQSLIKDKILSSEAEILFLSTG